MIARIWSGESPLYWLLIPLSLLYGAVSFIRRLFYRLGIFRSWRLPVPVIIVGNLTAGGNGKTPMVIWLVEHLKAKGIKPAVISRGYGGKAERYPLLLEQNTTTAQAGDEPVLIYRRTQVPVAVAPKRSQAIERILADHVVDVIIADDGLQHYALQRDMELVVVDGMRRFGNGWWLPAGPMRERETRLNSVSAVIVNGGEPLPGEVPMKLVAGQAINLLSGEKRPVETLGRVVAMAGIGYPPRFFNTLSELGVAVEQTYAFADHQDYKENDLGALTEKDQILLMTEKDAVKCHKFARSNWWYLPVDAVIPESAEKSLLAKIDNVLADRNI